MDFDALLEHLDDLRVLAQHEGFEVFGSMLEWWHYYATINRNVYGLRAVPKPPAPEEPTCSKPESA